MPVKVIAYLLIGVFSVLVAVALFVKVWSVFVGQDTVSADVQGLAKIIDNMLQDERPYIQQPYILQLQDNSLVGFEEGKNEISSERLVPDIQPGYTGNSGPPPMKLEKTTITATKECGTGGCICVAKANTANECFPIDNNERFVTFAMHAPGLEMSQPIKKTVFFPSSTPTTVADSEYYELWFNTNSFIYTRNELGKLTDEQRAKAVVPVLVEKINDPNSKNTWIIISPNTEEERSRYFYLETCSTDSKDGCAGQTPYSSFLTMKPNYCAPHDSQDSTTCKKTQLPLCVNKELVSSPCLCGTEVTLYGFCINNLPYPGTCDFVDKCKSYCEQDASGKCSYREKLLCSENACDTLTKCKFEGDVGTGSCVDDVAIALSQCTEGVAITSPCLCGTTTADKGYCIQGYLHNIECSAVNSCQDYCNNTGSSACSPSQIQECQLDPCGKECATTQDPSNYKYACVSEQAFNLDCSTGRVQTCQDYCNLLSYTVGDFLGVGAKGTCFNKEIDFCEADDCNIGCVATTTRTDSGSEGVIANMFRTRPRREGTCEPI